VVNESGIYTVTANCSNCGHEFHAVVPFGQPVPPLIRCPRCGCKTAMRLLRRTTSRTNVLTQPMVSNPLRWSKYRNWNLRCSG
jgi:rRNA maturation protein Nop10